MYYNYPIPAYPEEEEVGRYFFLEIPRIHNREPVPFQVVLSKLLLQGLVKVAG